jgi:pyruvate/2-oxoglutarate dehydrogenase complex dihydrolipoamide acyltransferase (E2) component
MTTNVIIPRLGSSDESDEVRILRWLKKQGDEVHRGEPIVEVETDKVNVEIEAPEDGRLDEIFAQEGEFTKFGAVVAAIDTPA